MSSADDVFDVLRAVLTGKGDSPFESDEAYISHLIDALWADRPISQDKRREVAMLLFHLLQSSKLESVLRQPVRGAPKTNRPVGIAIDYLIQRELYGPGKAEKAKQDVGEAWGISKETVAGYRTDHGEYAEEFLAKFAPGAETMDQRVSTDSGAVTIGSAVPREVGLRAISDALRARNLAEREKKKSGRKK